MRAQWLLLTHFSQRYPKATPVFGTLSDAASPGSPAGPASAREPRRAEQAELEALWTARTGLAFDLLQVRGQDLPRLVALREVYPTVFASDGGADGDDDGAAT